MEAAYSVRKASTASGCSSTKSLRATMQPMVKVPAAPTSCHTSLRSMASRTSAFCIMTLVAAGTGSMHRSIPPEAMRAVTSSLVFHSIVTSSPGVRPLSSSR